MNHTADVPQVFAGNSPPRRMAQFATGHHDGRWVALLLLVVYLPVCFGEYAVSDDYTWLWASTQEWQRWPEFFAKYWSDGRPFVFVSLLLLKFTGTVAVIFLARIPAVLGIAVLGWRIWKTARDAGWSRSSCIALALTIGSAPALQVSANWVVCATFVYACLATEWAVTAVWRHESDSGVGVARWTFAILANLFAFLCFQPAGCFVWVWTVIRVAPRTSNLAVSFRRCLRVLTVFVVAAGLAYLLLKTSPASTSRAQLATDIPRKLYWFLRNPVLDSLALTSAMYRWAGWSITTFLVLLSAIGFAKLRRLPATLLLVAACVPLSFVPNLVIAECWTSYRTQLALGPCIAVLLWGAYEATFAVTSPRAAKFVAAIATTLLTTIAAGQLIWGYTIPQTREWHHLNAALSRFIDQPASDRLEIRLAEHGDAVGAGARYDEFGVPSALNDWAAQPMVLLALHERGRPAPARFIFLPPEGQPSAHGIDLRGIRPGHRVLK